MPLSDRPPLTEAKKAQSQTLERKFLGQDNPDDLDFGDEELGPRTCNIDDENCESCQ